MSFKLTTRVLGGTLLFSPFLAHAQYAVTDLGTLPGGTSSNAYAINASGQVVGISDTTSGGSSAYHGFL